MNELCTSIDATGVDVELEHHVERMLRTGRVIFLLDSLDQSDPDPASSVVKALRELCRGKWKACPVWISGRPYAFRIASEKRGDDPRNAGLADLDPASTAVDQAVDQVSWQFIRIGALDEPETRQLLETARPLGGRR